MSNVILWHGPPTSICLHSTSNEFFFFLLEKSITSNVPEYTWSESVKQIKLGLRFKKTKVDGFWLNGSMAKTYVNTPHTIPTLSESGSFGSILAARKDGDD